MTTIDPNSAQTALFEKLGISKQSDAQKEKKDTLGQSDFFKINDDATPESRSICPNGQW